MQIPRFVISDLKSRVNIVDLLDREYGLNKLKYHYDGKGAHACCPFHDDKTPSLSISLEHNTYHCHACGERGDAVDALMYQGKDFFAALDELCNYAGISSEDLLDSIKDLNAFPTEKNINKDYLILTNTIFDKFSDYDVLDTKRPAPTFRIPDTEDEVRRVLTRHNFMFAADLSGYANALNHKKIIDCCPAAGLSVTDDSPDLPGMQYYLPAININNKSNCDSPLPLIRKQAGLWQYHCSGFVVMNGNLDVIDVFPPAMQEDQHSLLMPPPTQMGAMQQHKTMYVVDDMAQYIDAVSCGITNVVAPVVPPINTQHLRQLSQIQTKELVWVTTAKQLKSQELISKMSLFSEVIGGEKELAFVLMKESDSPFSDLLFKHQEHALIAAQKHKVGFAQFIERIIPNIANLRNAKQRYAIEAVQSLSRRLIKSEVESEVSQSRVIMTKLAEVTGKTEIQVLANVLKIPESTLQTVSKNLVNTPSKGIEEIDYAAISIIKDSVNSKCKLMILRSEFEPSLTELDNLLLRDNDYMTGYQMVGSMISHSMDASAAPKA